MRIEDLAKTFGRRATVVALDGITLDIAEGEIVVLLGPSGCGKTTLLRCIAGLETPDSGRIYSGDRIIADPVQGINVPVHQRNLGMVFQNYALWPHMKVRDNVMYPLLARNVDRRRAAGAANNLLELLQCAQLADRYPAQLSGGQQQRIALARSLAGSPGTILFDEPLSNLDEQLRRDVRAEIRRIHLEVGFTAVYVTHDQREGLELGDRVVMLRQGRIDQIGRPQEIYTRPASEYVARFLGVENAIRCMPGAAGIAPDLGPTDGPWRDLLGANGTDGSVVMIRATAVRVEPPNVVTDGRRCVIRGGRVRDVMYAGDRTVASVAFDGGVISASSTTKADEAIPVGDLADVSFDPVEALVYPADRASPSRDSGTRPQDAARVN